MIKADQTNLDLARIKAKTLIEAAPWIRNFQGKVFVVKFGGNAMVDEQLQQAFAHDIAFLNLVGIRAVVVHGGGPQITSRLSDLGIRSEFIDGLRVTPPEVIEVVREVLMNQISIPLAQMIEQAGAKAAVFNGETEGLFTASITRADLGLVGEVVAVNTAGILKSLNSGLIPIISTVAPDSTGTLINVNSDLAAASLAISLAAEKLVVLTDVPGLYSDWPNKESLVSELTATELEELLPDLESGMIPKMLACLNAVQGGVSKAHIIDGRVPHSILLEVFTPSGIGTLVLP
jgi:acetylglutamate kinase